MNKPLNKKKIIISAGPVYVPIDKVRVMTNIFGGQLGYFIAQEASRLGAKVTLLMGPGRVIFNGNEKFKVIKYKYFNDIYKILKNLLNSKKYHIIIHSAAIPDYIPVNTYKGKIKSGQKELIIRFKPTIKIIDKFRKWDKDIFIVKFKLEVGKTKKQLIKIASQSMMHSRADLIVANELNNISLNHKAIILDKNKNILNLEGKKMIAKELLELINQKLKINEKH